MEIICKKYIKNENGERFYEGDLVLITRLFGSVSTFVAKITQIDEDYNRINFEDENKNITSIRISYIKSIIKIDEITAMGLTKK